MRITFIFIIAADLALSIISILSGTLTVILISGFAANLMHGVIAGGYLYLLTVSVRREERSLTYGMGYALATIGAYILSLVGKGNFLM